MSLDMKIKKDFGGFVLDVELHAKNEVLALLGASGCGKSMTLKCISGIEEPDEGYIIVNDRVLFDSEKKISLSPQERHVGLLFQNYALFPNMNVEQNIFTGMASVKDINKNEKKKIVADMIDRFYLKGLEKHRPSQLSGGQQQRVALARIMVSRPQILMLDEPFSALDSFLRWELERELMKVLEDYDGTAILVSHNRDEVYRISDKVAVISDGHVDCFDTKAEVFENPKTYQSALLTGYRYFSRAEYIDETHIRAVDWNAVLTCPARPGVKYVTFRPDRVRVRFDHDTNASAAGFRIENAIDNQKEIILMLSAEGVSDGYSPDSDFANINMTISKDHWARAGRADHVQLEFDENSLILLDR